MMKKILAFLCVAFIILNIFVFADGAQDMTEYLYYVIEDGEVTITGCKDRDLEGDFYIPEKIENCPVTKIGDSAFSVCIEITSITLPDTVKSIGAGAFVKCTELQEIYLGNSLEFIGEEAFWCCFSLTSVNFPASLTKIEVGRSVFYECEALEKIEVDENNPVYYSQNNCLIEKNTKTVIAGCASSNVIPEDTKAIGDGAFSAAYGLKSIIIPEGVMSIGKMAFYQCRNIEEIIIPSSVVSIGESAFDQCCSLKGIKLPENLQRIEKDTFGCCESLEKIEIPQGVNYIGDDAFFACDGLAEIIIPASVNNIGSGISSGCENLECLIVNDGNLNYYSQNNCIIESNTKKIVAGCKNSIIPDDVITIGSRAFYVVGLKDVIIPATVTKIEKYAFGGKIENVYYLGKQDEWNGIVIDEYNTIENVSVVYEFSLTPVTTAESTPTAEPTEVPAPTPTETEMPNSFISAGEGRYSSIAIMTVVTILAMIFVVIFAFKERNKK